MVACLVGSFPQRLGLNRFEDAVSRHRDICISDNLQRAVPFKGAQADSGGQPVWGGSRECCIVWFWVTCSVDILLVWVRLDVGILLDFLPVFTILPVDCCGEEGSGFMEMLPLGGPHATAAC